MRVIDSHTHVWLAHAQKDRRALLECLDDVPLRRLYTSGLHGHDPDADTVTQINDAVLELMRADERIRGQVYLNPRHAAGVLDELERCLDRGFVMVKLWQATRAIDPLNDPVYARCTERSVPVLLHAFTPYAGCATGQSTPEDVAAVAARYPELVIQMAHMGGDFIRGVETVAPHTNVCVDPSGSYGERGMINYAVERLGAERVLFGSDMPGSDFYHNLGKILSADLTENQRELILWKNAERMLP